MLFRKSVDDLIKDIVNKVEQLHAIAELHAEEQKIHDETIRLATEARALAEREFNRAKSIAGKLTALVS